MCVRTVPATVLCCAVRVLTTPLLNVDYSNNASGVFEFLFGAEHFLFFVSDLKIVKKKIRFCFL